MNDSLKWKKYPVLNDGFICLVDSMGDDSAIVQAAKVSYGNDERKSHSIIDHDGQWVEEEVPLTKEQQTKDRALIRYLMNHQHWTPFEMVELKFLVRVPMDCWRQWIRHRTANVNEYSTRYKEAIDSQQTTPPEKWRLQAADNKQGSSGYLEANRNSQNLDLYLTGKELSENERGLHEHAKQNYENAIKAGIAKEQARKDLPLSTYTEAIWKCDLRNIFNFLHLRMDSHAQEEIRLYANAMYEIVKQVCPVACEAFEDYVLNARKFSAMEIKVLKDMLSVIEEEYKQGYKPYNMTDREWKAFLEKLVWLRQI